MPALCNSSPLTSQSRYTRLLNKRTCLHLDQSISRLFPPAPALTVPGEYHHHSVDSACSSHTSKRVSEAETFSRNSINTALNLPAGLTD
jgi:hypothetical protein